MPLLFRRRRRREEARALDASPELQQLQNETAQLLHRINRPARSPHVPKPRTTIQILEVDDEDTQVTSSTFAKRAVPSATSFSYPDSSAQLIDSNESDFVDEEMRVVMNTDTFVPDYSPSKHELASQQQKLAGEQHRLHDKAAKAAMKEVAKEKAKEHFRVRKRANPMDLHATKIQSLFRGSQTRRQMQQRYKKRTQPSAQASDAPTSVTDAVYGDWHQIRDVHKQEVWYYNSSTGNSQWEPPAAFQTASQVALPTLSPASPRLEPLTHSVSTPALSTPSLKVELPPVSPSSSSVHSSRSTLTPRPLTPTLPSLHSSDKSWTATLKPTDCDSVINSDDSVLGTGRSVDSMRLHQDAERMNDEEGPEADTDWHCNDKLFRADGCRNISKLRETVREALHSSKFDSISSLLSSSVMLKRKDPSLWSQTAQSRMDHSQHNQRDGEATSVSRKVVFGKRQAPAFVAAMQDKSKQSKKQLRVNRTPQKEVRSATRNPLSSAPPIRDMTDMGFQAVSDPSKTIQMSNPKESTSICFNCWSSSTGRNCEAHTSTSSLLIKPSESMLMCSNWQLNQLRKKYRAEELQEIFARQSASLRYNKSLKQYITVTECRHPIYRTTSAILSGWNARLRRTLRARSWLRSFLEQLQAGLVNQAKRSAVPSMMRLKTTLQNGKWCSKYSASVREYLPVAPVTSKDYSGQSFKTLQNVVLVNPSYPQQCNWVFATEYCTPIELYKPRHYELPPKRCVPMPTPSYLHDLPLPVGNVIMDAADVVSWCERLCARTGIAATRKALLQIKACSPPVGVTEARRTKHVTPVVVLFATFERKPTGDGMAIGGFAVQLLIHMLVTTYVPAQFGLFVVFDRRAICPSITKDHNAQYACLLVDPTTLAYVYRPLEHALNVRRPPTIVLATKRRQDETEADALRRRRFPYNRPEQTGEEEGHGFRTFLLLDELDRSDEAVVQAVAVRPSGDVVSANQPSRNPTQTTHVDRYYVFCVATTKENSPAEFVHLLWIGKSSRNQPQFFTTLGQQQPGDFMKNSDPDGAMGVCSGTVYRSWAYAQSSPYEQFQTDDGIPYWFDRITGETYWSRPVLPIEKYRGKDGEVDGVVADGVGEKASVGVGVDNARYSQEHVRKYMNKAMEDSEMRDRRLRLVAVSAKKDNISVSLQDRKEGGLQRIKPKGIERIQVPALSFCSNKVGSKEAKPKLKTAREASTIQIDASVDNDDNIDSETRRWIQTITKALNVKSEKDTKGGEMLQLGIGLGMGLALGKKQRPKSSDGIRKEGSKQAEESSHDDIELLPSFALSSRSQESSEPPLSTSRSTSDVPPPDIVDENDISNEKKPGFLGRKLPGKGESWTPRPVDATGESQTAVPGTDGQLHQHVSTLPTDFLEVVSGTKTCPLEASYLPSHKNTNVGKGVGVIWPKPSLEEWVAMGYSPWSAGRSVFNTEFISNLLQQSEISEGGDYLSKMDIGSDKPTTMGDQAAKVSEEQLHAQQLDSLFSLCRHGKYEELEAMVTSPDWALDIDAKDALGNTLLSVACQNNNKRIAKLCLRRGADINTQNVNGQSILHYCHVYGFHDLMDYLLKKGARDDLVNADGLTCYEGLDKETIDAI